MLANRAERAVQAAGRDGLMTVRGGRRLRRVDAEGWRRAPGAQDRYADIQGGKSNEGTKRQPPPAPSPVPTPDLPSFHTDGTVFHETVQKAVFFPAAE